jgi:DNA processing protein
MKISILRATDPAFPATLLHIPDPPKQLYILGNAELLSSPHLLAVVGSRGLTPYGRAVTDQLSGAAASKGIVIVSGMALGVDGIAHRAALQAGGKTVAVLANGLDRMYPATHRELAKHILERGGAIVSEYPEGTEPHRHHFVARNRIVSGLSSAVLITEAAAKSGTIHTAQFALEQGREVMAVPGNITSPLSAGTNQLIKTGAMPVTDAQDIIQYFGLDDAPAQQTLVGSTQEEQIILDLLAQGIADSAELLHRSQLDAALFNQTLTMLEITGKVKPLGSSQWRRG